MKTREEILKEIFITPKSNDWYYPVLNAMGEYGKQKWEEACTATLNDISIAFLSKTNQDKADRISDKDVFQAIGETINKFPKLEYKE